MSSAPHFARAVAPFLCATALVSIPAFAQDAAPQTAPPVVATPPNAATVTIPPVVPTLSLPDTPSPAAEPAADVPQAATRSSATRTTRARSIRPLPRAAAPAPRAPAPVPMPAPRLEPVAAAPAPAPVVVPAQPVLTPRAAADATTQATNSTNAVPLWAWLGGGLAILAIALVGLFALRRRRAEDYVYDEPVYVDEPAVEPVALVPVAEVKQPSTRVRANAAVEPVVVAPEELEIASAPDEAVADLTAAAPLVAERPWLEFAMRPVRAGTNVDEALVEIELTVGNAGSLPAEDVRISTFLLSGDPDGSEMERLLVAPPADATTDPVTIQPGEGKRIDATLALLKAEMGENLPAAFRPIVVADARYTMADGSEGRTSASFAIGVTPEEGEGLDAIELSRSSMHDNVGAQLHGEPVHA